MNKKSLCCWMLLSLAASACGSQEGSALGTASAVAQRSASLASDTTPPESIASTTPDPSPEGDYYGVVTVHIQASDDSAGVESITYSLSGASSGSQTVSGSSAYVQAISNLGTTTVTYFARDKAGNVEAAKTLTITLKQDPGTCITISLNEANLFMAGSYNGGHDVQGKVMAGGDINMENFSVGASLAADDVENVLVAGGNLNIAHGGIFGNAHHGGTTTANGTTTFYRGALSQGNPIDFETRYYELTTVSYQLGYQTSANAQPQFQSWGGLFLKGTNTKMNVINVSADTLAQTRYLSIEAPAESIMVVNVWGPAASFGGFSTNFSGGIDQRGVLYNFPDAMSITATGVGIWGTVLAPYADVDFSGGSFDGGIYVNSLTGNAEGHVAPLRDFELCGISGT